MIERINGYTTLGSSRVLQKVTGIFPFVREDGSTTFLVTDSSITLETADYKSWTFVSSGSNTGAILRWKQVRNKMWGFNGVDFPMTWDGAVKNILNGNSGTPNVPKFKFMEFYQDRVWGGNIPGAASDLYFTATITTDNVIIAPDNQFAWPADHLVHVGQGDGQIMTALWIADGRLRVGKERSIYTIFGDNPSAYNPRKENAQVGVVSDEAVSILDGQTHFPGQDGIYRNVERISDQIEPNFELINKGASNIIGNVWDTQLQFAQGNFFGSTATADGSLTQIVREYGELQTPSGIDTFRYIYVNGTLQPSPGVVTLTPGTSFYGPYQLKFSVGQIPDSSRVSVGKILFNNTHNINTCSLKFASVTVYNGMTGEIQQSTVTDFGGLFNNNAQVPFVHPYPLFNGNEVNLSSMAIKIEGCGFDIATPDNIGVAFINATTSQYMSEVSTLASVTAWGNFSSERITGGGNVSYYLRTSTSIVNIATKTWTAIAPGAVIAEPTINNYVQWAATITSVSTAPAITYVDNVNISHVEGQAGISRAFAATWKNRYWLAVTTTSDATIRTIYVKSKGKDGWSVIEGYPIACMTANGDFLYGGSASTGTVYRLDYGTNFDGRAIQSIYDTPDLTLGDPFFDKEIYKYMVDGEKSLGSQLTVRTFKNGSLLQNNTFSNSGSGRFSKVIEGVRHQAKTLRLRFENSQLDQPFTIHNLSIIYEPTRVLSDQ